MLPSLYKQVWCHNKWVIAGLTPILSAALAAPAVARTYEFVFGNYTGQDLVGLYWRSATAEEDKAGAGGWGGNFLAEGTVLPADTLVKLLIDDAAPPLSSIDLNEENVIYPDDCSFDVRGVLANGDMVEEYGINLCEISEAIGFFDFVDTEAFYDEGGKELFITNAADFPLIELTFENENAEQFFVFGNALESELGESPTLPAGETELFLVDLPESVCDYQVTPRFWNQATGEKFEPIAQTINFCSNFNGITASAYEISIQSFGAMAITVENSTPHRLVSLEVAPSFRPELWSDVIQGDFVGANTRQTVASAIQLTTNNEQARCFYDIHGVLVTNAATAEQIFVEQYFTDLCATSGGITFREGIVID